MFCKYCGKKMDNVSEVCPNCRKEQGSLQATDGYFGVLTVGNAVSGNAMSGSNDKRVEELTVVCKKLKNDMLSMSDSTKKYRKKVNLFGTLGIIMVLLFAFMFVFIYCTHVQRSKKELEDLRDKMVSLETQLQAVSALAQQNVVTYEEALKQVEVNFANEFTVLKENYEQAIETLQEENSKSLDSVKQQFVMQLQKLKEEYHPIEEAASEEEETAQQNASEGRDEKAPESERMAEFGEDQETAVEEGKADE